MARPVRYEYNRPSDLELVRLCKQVPLQSHITAIEPGVLFMAQCPVGVVRIVRLHDDGTHTVATFNNQADADTWVLRGAA